jgi:hypothetical protein
MKYPLTLKAQGATYEGFIAAGWTDEQMMIEGYMENPEGLVEVCEPYNKEKEDAAENFDDKVFELLGYAQHLVRARYLAKADVTESIQAIFVDLPCPDCQLRVVGSVYCDPCKQAKEQRQSLT